MMQWNHSFMNFFIMELCSMPPIYKAENGLEVIRPLIFCRERQLRAFANTNEINVIGDEACPGLDLMLKCHMQGSKQKELLAKLEEEKIQNICFMKSAFKKHSTWNIFYKDLNDLITSSCEEDNEA